MRDDETIMLAWPDAGQVAGDFAMSVASLYAHVKQIRFIYRQQGSAVSFQRNSIVHRFLGDEHCFDWLLMLDSDESVSVGALAKLMNVAESTSHPIVSGLVFSPLGSLDPATGHPGVLPTIYRQSTEAGPAWRSIEDYPSESVIPIDVCGAGFLLVHRSVFQAIYDATGDPWGFFREATYNGGYLGEDFYFCMAARRVGFQIYAHTGAVATHHKTYELGETHYRLMRSLQSDAVIDHGDGSQ